MMLLPSDSSDVQSMIINKLCGCAANYSGVNHLRCLNISPREIGSRRRLLYPIFKEAKRCGQYHTVESGTHDNHYTVEMKLTDPRVLNYKNRNSKGNLMGRILEVIRNEICSA